MLEVAISVAAKCSCVREDLELESATRKLIFVAVSEFFLGISKTDSCPTTPCFNEFMPLIRSSPTKLSTLLQALLGNVA